MTIEELLHHSVTARATALVGVAVTQEQYDILKDEAWKQRRYEGALSAISNKFVFGAEVRVVPADEPTPAGFLDLREL
jgi:hypothetical protein